MKIEGRAYARSGVAGDWFFSHNKVFTIDDGNLDSIVIGGGKIEYFKDSNQQIEAKV